MLTQLKALADAQEKATKGPWLYRPNKYDDWGVIKEGNNSIGKDHGYFVARAGYGDYLTQEIEHGHRLNKTDPYAPNALFIALSGSTNFRQLHDRMKAMEEALREMLDQIEACQIRSHPISQNYGALDFHQVWEKQARKALGEMT